MSRIAVRNAQAAPTNASKTPQSGLLSRRANGQDRAASVPPIVHEVLNSPGQPLDAATRAYMEPRFGHDFSKVRVHADARAGEAAESIDARAFTSNRSIVFGAGEYAPQTESGRRLVPHELTHVVQQRAGVHVKDGVGETSDAYEQHADIVSRAFVGGRSSDGLLDAHRLPVAEMIGAPLQSRVTIQRQTSEQRSISSEAASNQSVALETTAEAPQSSNPLVIEAAVGAKANNRVDDVAKVQARLFAVGLLSEASFTAESPKAATPASVQSTTGADAGVASSITPEAPTTSPSESLSTTTTAPNLSAEASPASAATVVADTTPATVPESSLTATISAICEFQRPLFSKQDVDGNVGPSGPTWRALCAADAAAVAKMKEGWRKKKQQVEEEKARKLKADAERRQREAWEQSPEAEQGRTAAADKLIAAYATYIPFTSLYVSLDESGLARVLGGVAKSNGRLVLKTFDGLQEEDTDDVAYEMVRGASDSDLATFGRDVLERLKSTMTGGVKTAEEIEQISRIDDALGGQSPGAAAKTKDGSKQVAVGPGKIPGTGIDRNDFKARFCAQYYEMAELSERETGVPTLVTLGQAVLESAWGKSAPGNNLFGIKSDASASPETRQLLRTTEVLSTPDKKFPEVISVTKRADGKYLYVVRDWFKSYSSAAQGFSDHGNFLRRNKRYKLAFEHQDDPYAFADEIAKAGYATATNYAESLKRTMREVEQIGAQLNLGGTMPAANASKKKVDEKKEATKKISRPKQDEVLVTVKADQAAKLIAKYTNWGGLNLDESGLARALVSYAKADADLVLKVFDVLDEDNAVEVADEMVKGKSVKDLAIFDRRVRAYLKSTISGGGGGEQIAGLDEVLGTDPALAGGKVGSAPEKIEKNEKGQRRARAAKELVDKLQAAGTTYKRELTGRDWNNTKISDCSKFVQWALEASGESELFGRQAATTPMMEAIIQKATADKKLAFRFTDPKVGDIMMWGGHVGIVYEVVNKQGTKYLVYANMGNSGPNLIGRDSKGGLWLKTTDTKQIDGLGAGTFLGFWTPP